VIISNIRSVYLCFCKGELMKFPGFAMAQLAVASLAGPKAFVFGSSPKSFIASRNLPRSSTAAFSTTTSKTHHQEIHAPVGEDGAGEYTAATKGCCDVIDKATPLALESIKSIWKSKRASPFSIADFGTADAGTSLGVMAKIVKRIRGYSADREVILNYEDQATYQ
jgi:hypothetical protein